MSGKGDCRVGFGVGGKKEIEEKGVPSVLLFRLENKLLGEKKRGGPVPLTHTKREYRVILHVRTKSRGKKREEKGLCAFIIKVSGGRSDRSVTFEGKKRWCRCLPGDTLQWGGKKRGRGSCVAWSAEARKERSIFVEAEEGRRERLVPVPGVKRGKEGRDSPASRPKKEGLVSVH